MIVTLDATVPAGAGLGSSAAMAIAVGRALLEFYDKAISDEALFDAAMASERVFHGNPSGLDHMAAMRGGVFRFLRGQPPVAEPITLATPLQLVVAQVDRGGDTGIFLWSGCPVYDSGCVRINWGNHDWSPIF
jgi:mevalonate kinase